MAQLSRYEKYRDLRAKMQSDTGSTGYESQDLADFASRLNQIDADNFAAPDPFSGDSFSAAHARNTAEASSSRPLRRTQSSRMNPLSEKQKPAYSYPEEDTFGHDYLDQYIREVKKYNIEQGNAASENTQMNILSSLHKTEETPPSRPYRRQPEPVRSQDTADIPFVRKQRDDDTEKLSKASQDTTQGQAMTREDIMAEVQNLVNGTSKPSYQIPDDSSPSFHDDRKSGMSEDTFNRHLEAERSTRQQLLNETAQMRAQLDDYEDNLSEVTNKMRQTNRILNIVLVVLIIALAVIFGVVIYWIMTTK
ncbi:MAG: hypothetical protein ACI32N_03810 [Bulleidia sp.]